MISNCTSKKYDSYCFIERFTVTISKDIEDYILTMCPRSKVSEKTATGTTRSDVTVPL